MRKLLFLLLVFLCLVSCTYNDYNYYGEEEHATSSIENLKVKYPDLPITPDIDIVNGKKPVTIAANNEIVARILVPTGSYGKCDIEWSTIHGLTCEGQYISCDKYAISTYINGKWEQNKHRNWESPAKDKDGKNIAGSGEGGGGYNIRYSI